MNEPLV